MKKKVLAGVLSSISVFSYAEVNLYGKLAVGLENDQFQNTTVPGTNSVQDFGSYFGIRGTDPVYGETTGIWQVEQFLDLTTGQPYYNTTGGGLIAPQGGIQGPYTGHVSSVVNTLASSESYLGLRGTWGMVRIGNLSNYSRSDQGAVDIYNGSNAVGFALYSRTTKLIPSALRYDSPRWGGFTLVGEVGFNTLGLRNITSISSSNDYTPGGLNGTYSGNIYNVGLGWKGGNYSVTLGGTMWQQVGSYVDGTGGMNIPSGLTNDVQYSNAYVTRLEVGYNNPDAFLIGVGWQVTSGLGWAGWANSGGAMHNIQYNPGVASYINDLYTNQYGTNEVAASIGWHIGGWTPKLGYAYGNNLMTGGSFGNYIDGSAKQIKDSGYNMLSAELDWNITPRTIVFLSYGQAWFGQTLENIAYGGARATADVAVNGTNQYMTNQSTTAIGFSQTF